MLARCRSCTCNWAFSLLYHLFYWHLVIYNNVIVVTVTCADQSVRHGLFQLRLFLHLAEPSTVLLLPCFHDQLTCHHQWITLDRIGQSAVFLFPFAFFKKKKNQSHYEHWVCGDWPRLLYSEYNPWRYRWVLGNCHSGIYSWRWFVKLVARWISCGQKCSQHFWWPWDTAFC